MDFMQFIGLITHVDKTLGLIIEQYGTLVYALLFAIVFCETGLVVLFFLPGDTLLFVGGTLCVLGKLNVFGLIGLLIVAAITGNTTNYWIGKLLGQRVFTHDFKWLNKDGLHRTHDFFQRHGGKTIVLSRFVPVVRTFAPFVAGVSEMTFATFQFYNVIGAVTWVVLLVTTGYMFGNVSVIREHLNAIVLIGTAAAVSPVLLGGLWKLLRRWRRR